MENFRNKLKVNSETMERLNAINQEYKKSGRELEFQDKIATAVYMAILDVDTNDEKEQAKKLEYLHVLNEIICNYDDLEPFLSEYIKRKKQENIQDALVIEQKRTLTKKANHLD